MSAAFQEDAQANQGLVDTIVQTVLGMLNEPTSLPQNFKGWLPKYLEVNPPLLPISQVSGFSQFSAQTSSGTNAFSGTLAPGNSASGDGPVLSGLGTGKYLVIVSFSNTSSSAYTVSMSVTLGTTTVAAYATGSGNPSSGKTSITQIGLADLATGGDITSTWATGGNGFSSNQSYGLSDMFVAVLKYANA